MTKEAILAVLTKYKAILIMFDNDEYWFISDKPDENVTEASFETLGGVDFIKKRDYIASKRGGPNGGISKNDIAVWSYKPLETIQGLQVMENPDDFKYIDRGRLYVI